MERSKELLILLEDLKRPATVVALIRAATSEDSPLTPCQALASLLWERISGYVHVSLSPRTVFWRCCRRVPMLPKASAHMCLCHPRPAGAHQLPCSQVCGHCGAEATEDTLPNPRPHTWPRWWRCWSHSGQMRWQVWCWQRWRCAWRFRHFRKPGESAAREALLRATEQSAA